MSLHNNAYQRLCWLAQSCIAPLPCPSLLANPMHIDCTNCHRSYELDDAKATGATQAACLCGVVLVLRPGARGAAQVGRYTLVNQIAVGGMGEIWFALQQGSDGFEKEVVVKRLLPNLAADREVTAMLIKEAKVSSRLKHPNIVEVYDLVRLDGNYLIVMEYVPGITVKDLVNACCRADVVPPWELAVYIVLQLLRGLGYAHRLPQRDKSYLTFIHRDISPQNLLICPDGTIKITDFGIAKALNEASTTAPGLIRGKTSYLSPERVRGGDVNEASDLFPAAIVLYEVWTLHSLFRADKQDETLRKLFETHVPALQNYRQDVSPALEAVMRKALARRAPERYPSAQAFEAALLEACHDTSTEQIQAAASGFLRDHSVFFESIDAHKDGPEDASAEARAARAQNGKVVSIDTLLRTTPAAQRPVAMQPAQTPRRNSPKWWPLAIAVGLFVLGFGAAALLWGTDLFAPDLPRGATAEIAPTSAGSSALPSSLPREGITLNGTSPNAVLPKQADDNAQKLAAEVPAAPTAAPTSALLVAPTPEPKPDDAVLPILLATERPPRRRELNAFFRHHTPRLLACLKDVETEINADIEVRIAPSGRLAADVESAGLDAASEACLSRYIERLHYRAFVGAPVKYTLPLHAGGTTP